jgi:N-acetylmuramoyl-L-alanine amidase
VEDTVLVRLLILFVLLSLPLPARAAGYIVRPGDTLGSIAIRHHVSLSALARVNGIRNVDLVLVGRVLLIPSPVGGFSRTFYYHVRWGDTLIGIAARYRLDIATIRSLNPRLGTYPLAGQWLKLCSGCSRGSLIAAQPQPGYSAADPSRSNMFYVVQPGDTLSSIAARYRVAPYALKLANRILNPDFIAIGWRLTIPSGWAIYAPSAARSTISSYAQAYGIEPPLALAVGWQESGFNQTAVSQTGAVGVMQVEPYTAQRVSQLLGRPFNLYSLDDNAHAGVFWLAHLVAFYGGNERLAVAAYYEGTKAVARYGFFQDTVQYVNDVMALKTTFGG